MLCTGKVARLFISNDYGRSWQLSKTIQVEHEICAASVHYVESKILIGGPNGEVTFIRDGRVVNTVCKHDDRVIGFDINNHSYGLDGRRCYWSTENDELKLSSRLSPDNRVSFDQDGRIKSIRWDRENIPVPADAPVHRERHPIANGGTEIVQDERTSSAIKSQTVEQSAFEYDCGSSSSSTIPGTKVAVDFGNSKCLMIREKSPRYFGILRDSRWIRQLSFDSPVKQAIVDYPDNFFTLHHDGSIKLMSKNELLSSSENLKIRTLLMPTDPPTTAICKRYMEEIYEVKYEGIYDDDDKTLYYIQNNALFRLDY